MSFSRPAFALSPHRFGRRAAHLSREVATESNGLTDDLRLFAATFAAGFLFVSILIG
jgi:hypothetical protein